MSYCTSGKQGYFDLCNAAVKHYLVQNGNLQPVQPAVAAPNAINGVGAAQAVQAAAVAAPEEISMRYVNWKRKANYRDFCKMRKYFEWRHGKPCSCSDGDCKTYYDWKLSHWKKHYDDKAYEPHFQAWKKYFDLNDQKKYKDWADWKKKKVDYKTNPQKYLEKMAVEDIKAKIQAMQPQAAQVKDQIVNAIQGKAEELKANGVDVNAVVEKVVDQVKVAPPVNGQANYGPADYLRDKEYRSWKKHLHLREYAKFRRFVDFYDWAQKNNRGIDKKMFHEWKKANNMLYNNKKRFECDYREFKHACNFNHYEQYKLWVALRTKKHCPRPEKVCSETTIEACGSTLSDESELGCPSYSCSTRSKKCEVSSVSSDSSYSSYSSPSESDSCSDDCRKESVSSCSDDCRDKSNSRNYRESTSDRTNYSNDTDNFDISSNFDTRSHRKHRRHHHGKHHNRH